MNPRALRLVATLARVLVALVAFSLVLSGPLAFAPSAFAQTTAPRKTVREELPPEAVRAWDDGRLLLQQNNPDYEKALVKFREAYEASKNPRVLYNVAVCEKNLNRYARAATTFRRELDEGRANLSEAEIADIEAAIGALERFVAKLDIQGNEAGAEVLVDGERVGELPLAKSLAVDIGTRVVTLRKAGFVEQSREVLVHSGDTTRVVFELEPLDKKARVTVTVVGPPSAKVKMDNVDMGPAPFTGDVPVGRHTWSAEAPGYETATQTSEVRFREAANITLAMAKKRQEGRLRVESAVPSVTLELDGKVIGTTPWEGIVPSGAHQLIARKDGYDDATLEINMTDDASLSRKLTLTERKSSAWVGWAIGAAVVVGGGVVAGYFILRPDDETPIPGSLRADVGVPVPAHFRF